MTRIWRSWAMEINFNSARLLFVLSYKFIIFSRDCMLYKGVNIIRAANNHLIFRSYFKSDLHLLMFLRDFVLAILIKISYRALFFRRCPLPCKIFFSIQIFLLGTGHLQKKRAQLKSSKYFCWALFF